MGTYNLSWGHADTNFVEWSNAEVGPLPTMYHGPDEHLSTLGQQTPIAIASQAPCIATP